MGQDGQTFGILFDWDGVIIDSSRHHEESWERLASEARKTLPTGHFLKGFGMKNELIIRDLLEWSADEAEIARLSLRKEELYRDIIRERGIQALPGVREFLSLLSASGIPCAIGSSTHRLNIESALRILGLEPMFRAIVSAEDVDRGKPDPQVFLKAASALGLAPRSCLVFEDAHVGIEAAHAAGMVPVAVATTHPAASFSGTRARAVVARMDELTLSRLGALLAR